MKANWNRTTHVVRHRPGRAEALRESQKRAPTGKRPPVTLPAVSLTDMALDLTDGWFGHQWGQMLAEME